MSKVINKEFKKANIHANSAYHFYQLERKSEHLLDCKVSKSVDEVNFAFTYRFEQPFETVKEMALTSKYQVLLNVQNLLVDIKRIQISIDPGNLVIDTNMMPKAIMRDVYEESSHGEQDFVEQYKALIGYVLQSKYSFNDYYQGGNALLKKHKSTSAFLEINSLEGIVDTLNKELKTIQEKMKTSLIEVDKGKYKRGKIAHKVVLVLFVIAIVIGGYFGGFRYLEEKTINKANEAYIAEDYISVIKALAGINLKRMDKNTKYVLAVSNIKVETLTDEQKNNILASVTMNSDERILDFWIYLGKSSYDKAIDIAKQLGNQEYLAYGYMNEKAQVANDKSLTGAQREEKMKSIDSSLKDLNIDDGNKNKDTKDATTK